MLQREVELPRFMFTGIQIEFVNLRSYGCSTMVADGYILLLSKHKTCLPGQAHKPSSHAVKVNANILHCWGHRESIAVVKATAFLSLTNTYKT